MNTMYSIHVILRLTIVCITGAICFGISALCTGIAVSYYAAVVVQDFYASGGMAGVGLSKLPIIRAKT